jgi:ketosteroid isomerase-like protein
MTQKISFLKIAVLAVTLLAGTYTGASSQSLLQQDIDAIQQQYADYSQAIVNSDVEAAMAVFADQGVEIFPSLRSNIGKHNISSRYIQMFRNSDYSQFDHHPLWLEGTGSIVVSWGRQVLTFQNQDQVPQSFHGYHTSIFRKQPDGSWKTLVVHGRNLPEQEPQAPEISATDKEKIMNLLKRWDETGLEKADPDTKVECIAELYSDQALQVSPNQMSNIGKPNLMSRWRETIGDFEYVECNLGARGIGGAGNMAVGYGTLNQSFYYLGQEELTQWSADWAIIFTREQDNWKILAVHWLAN